MTPDSQPAPDQPGDQTAPGAPRRARPSRRLVLAGAATLAAQGLWATGRGAQRASAATGAVLQNTASGSPFMLGASGDGVADGSYAAALGRGLDITATWADDDASMVALTQLRPGGELAGWNASLDIAIGAFDRGGSWAAAARGDYDARWTASLQALATLRAGRAGTTYIRLAHEMNGNWYPWSVTTDQRTDFIAGWKRFRALQLKIYPTAKLVFSVNHNTVGYAANWTALYPGTGQVDVMGLGIYDHYPYLPTDAAFAAALGVTNGYGGPTGLGSHQAFAQSVGLPLAVSEWSGVADATGGDSPAFITGMHSFFTAHAGAGAGQVLYACQFNVSSGHDGIFNLLIGSSLPQSSATYRSLFGR